MTRYLLSTPYGNLTQVEEPGSLFTTYQYNEVDQLTLVTMGAQTRTFQYNAARQLRKTTFPENGLTEYTYNPNGTLLSRKDARNQTLTYTYDAYKRVTATSGGVTYTYDTATNGKGRLGKINYSWKIDGASVEESYGYTPAGLPTGKLVRIAQPSTLSCGSWYTDEDYLSAGYEWDDQGRLKKMTRPSGSTDYGDADVRQTSLYPYIYGYNVDGQLVSAKPDSGGQGTIGEGILDTLYGPAGEPTELRLLDGINTYRRETRAYNQLGQMTLQMDNTHGPQQSWATDRGTHSAGSTKVRLSAIAQEHETLSSPID